MDRAETLPPLASGDSQKVQNSLGSSARISKREEISVEERYKTDLLNKRDVVSPMGHVFNTAQMERIFKLVRQVAAKIYALIGGVSKILEANGYNGFKAIKDTIDLLSNITQYVQYILLLPKPKQLSELKQFLVACFYDAKTKEIVFEKLFSAISLICKATFKFTSQTACLQAVSKSFPYVDLLLGVMKLALNHEKYTQDGFTQENVLKVVDALSYHIISCAVFTIAAGSGGISAYALTTLLVVFLNRLATKGMRDIALIGQPIDKLLFGNKIANSVYSLVKSIHPFQNVTDESISRQRSIYLTKIGLKTCYSAVLEIIKIIREFRDSREIPETNVAETIPQEQKVIEDANENFTLENPESSVTSDDEQLSMPENIESH
ncbi:MAG: hypothetical protein LBC11_03885, partial [Puniceicoccales bacterium]|nr:hypothetical protein [Puniceicoccales bacterium]